MIPLSRRTNGTYRTAMLWVAPLSTALFLIGGSLFEHRDRGADGSASETWAWTLLAMLFAVSVGLVVFVGVRRSREREEEEAASRSGSAPTSPTPSPEREDSPVSLVLALTAGLSLLLGVLFLLGVFSGEANAQDAPRQFAYVMTRGADTLVVERVSRTRSGLTGEVATRGQGTVTFTVDLPNGSSVTGMMLAARAPGAAGDATPLQSAAMRFANDSAFIEMTAGANTQRLARAASGDPLPIMNNEFALIDLFVARAWKARPAKYTGKMFAASGGVNLDATVEFVGTDSAVFTIAGSQSRCKLDADGHISGINIAAQGIIVTRVSGAAAAKISLGAPDYGAPAGAPYRAEEVTVQTPMGHVLTGTLTIPLGASGKLPAVVTITGSGQEDRDEYISLVPGYRLFRQVADTLGRRGIAVLRLDDRQINGSGGDLTKATSADFADDIRAGIAYLRTRAEIDGARIAVVGHSEGGIIGPMIAASDPKLKAVVLMAGPAYTGQTIINFQMKNLIGGNAAIPAASKDSATKAALADFTKSANAWTKFFLTYDPIPTLQKVKQPVLILQGATDQQVTPEQAPLIEKTLRAAGNRNVSLAVFPERNHLFLKDPVGFPGDYSKLKSGKVDADVMGALAEWLVTVLGAK